MVAIDVARYFAFYNEWERVTLLLQVVIVIVIVMLVVMEAVLLPLYKVFFEKHLSYHPRNTAEENARWLRFGMSYSWAMLHNYVLVS